MRGAQFRPPAEAGSLILQTDTGCPHNRCTFCGMYRRVKFQSRAPDEIHALIEAAARKDPNADRIFLADGDVMRRPFKELCLILDVLIARFPRLARVNLYANGRSILQHSEDELRALRSRKLQTLYMGLESGDPEVLRRCRKPDTGDQMIEAGRRAGAAGLRMSVMVLLGLGGTERTAEHADRTADALNRMQPRQLSALRVVPIPGTELYDDRASGRFTELSEWAVVHELRRMIARLELTHTVFRANHSSNIIPIEARFPREKNDLISRLDNWLASDRLDRNAPAEPPPFL